MAGRIRRHWKGLLAGAVLLAVVLVVGIPYVYIHFIEGEQPPPLSLSDVTEPLSTTGARAGEGAHQADDSPDGSDPVGGASGEGGASGTERKPSGNTAATASDSAQPDSVASGSGNAGASAVASSESAADGLAGIWTIGNGSQAGYRVNETLAGQKAVAVGRTDQVSGSITITDTAITSASIVVQVATITSDNGQRNNQFTGRIMNTSQYPTATFKLTEPIALDPEPTTDTSITLSATGDLTLHGTTKQVTFPISVQRTAAGLAATGSIDIQYQDYGIPNPSIGGFVSVGDAGTIEFLLVAARG